MSYDRPAHRGRRGAMSGYSIVRADAVEEVAAGAVVRVAPATVRSHRNEGDEPVEMWAVSPLIEEQDATKVEDFWEPSPRAAQHAGG